MANDNICVFCGEKLSAFRSTSVDCVMTWQPACKSCAKELEGLSEEDLCRRALVRGLANEPERLTARLELLTEAENHRPGCLRCGQKLIFGKLQELDNSPYRNSLLSEPFSVRPAYCPNCGRYEFYKPEIIRKNKHLAHLCWKDSRD